MFAKMVLIILLELMYDRVSFLLIYYSGTCAYYFTTDELSNLASSVGLQVEVCEYIHRQYANRKQVKARYRVWLHAKFVKP
jgi:dihydroxyacid dehydratase/phosphogluconate dehydratase